MRRSVGLGATCALFALALAGCGNGKVIGSGPLPTPTPVTPNVSFEYKVPTANASPAAISIGTDGYLYFTEENASKIGQLSTGGKFNEYPTATANAGPGDIIIGPDRNMWYTERNNHAIATMGIADHKMTEHDLGTGAVPEFIVNGPQANTMYFTDSGNNAIGEIATDGTPTGPFPIPTAGADPLGIALGPDQNLWFCEYNANQIGHFDTTLMKVDHEYKVGLHPYAIIKGPDQALWFTENDPAGPKLGHLTQNGVFTEYPLTGAKSAAGLWLAADGNIYVADPTGNAIGQFVVNTLTFKEFTAKTTNSGPTSIAVGPDGKLYFTEMTADQIGQFTYF